MKVRAAILNKYLHIIDHITPNTTNKILNILNLKFKDFKIHKNNADKNKGNTQYPRIEIL
jgi:aspartate carbamoyltransferase regulatory subunit